jgi:ATP-binding cassette subfamily B protein
LSFLLILSFIPFFAACVYFSEKLRQAYEETRNQLSYFNSMLADFLYGMKTIRSLSLSNLKNQLLSRQIQNYSNAQIGMVREFAFFNPVLSLGIGVLFLILILKGNPLVDSGQMKTGEWIGILSYIFMLQQPLLEITDRWNFFLSGVTSIQRIKNVFDVKEEKVEGKEIFKLNEILLENVSFQYPSTNRVILDQVNLRIKRGDRIGIFGESGSGKTTFLQLLYGFYHPISGQITWNGISHHEISLRDLRAQFGVVEQFPFLFSGTIRDNIDLFGKIKIDFDSMRKKFSKYPLIKSILYRLDEEVRERGDNLSMGEKQMVSFLRAYFKSPSIWILDEATAFFDQEAESEFMDILNQLPHDTVIIQIAHRQEALKDMKRIIRVERNCLLE